VVVDSKGGGVVKERGSIVGGRKKGGRRCVLWGWWGCIRVVSVGSVGVGKEHRIGCVWGGWVGGLEGCGVGTW